MIFFTKVHHNTTLLLLLYIEYLLLFPFNHINFTISTCHSQLDEATYNLLKVNKTNYTTKLLRNTTQQENKVCTSFHIYIFYWSPNFQNDQHFKKEILPISTTIYMVALTYSNNLYQRWNIFPHYKLVQNYLFLVLSYRLLCGILTCITNTKILFNKLLSYLPWVTPSLTKIKLALI